MGDAPPIDWQSIAARKQAERTSRIPKEYLIPDPLLPPASQKDVHTFFETSGLLTPEELLITSSTASAIVAAIASRKWTAHAVTSALIKRAVHVHQLSNCLTELDFPAALARAAELDAFQARENCTVGPLHGLPISLKDQFNLAGLDSTIGYASWAFAPKTSNSTLVDLLSAAGAVFYAKTNVPTTLMMGESTNNLFGRTVNPRNRDLSTGGSSGGESALVSSCGSFLGVGTDIGGSIRNPASFTGLLGLRPSHGRVSYQDVTNTLLGQEAVRSSAGPLARCPEDIRLFMSAVAGQKGWLRDPQVLPIPWRAEEEKLPAKLCFGIAINGDGHVSPTPPLRRAMEITKEKLLAAGHEVIQYVPHELKEAMGIINKMWTADGGAEVRRDAAGEPLPGNVEKLLGLSDPEVKPMGVLDMWANQHARAELAQRFLARWESSVEMTGTGRPIDALIMPCTPFPAVRHGQPYLWNYAAMPPLLDLTSGVFPVTKVDLERDVVPEGWAPLSDKDEEIMKMYDSPRNHENALVGLSIIARRLEEEKVTAMLQLMRDVVGTDY